MLDRQRLRAAAFDAMRRGRLPYIPIATQPFQPPPPAAVEAPLTAGEVMGPPPAAAPDIASLLIAALGPPPNRAGYVTPFDQAEARAREAYNASLPAIDNAYSRLQGTLRTNNTDLASVQQRVAAEQAARHQQAQQQVASLTAPIQADLAAQAGGQAVPSLTNALAATGNQQQADLVAQAARQKALAAELATAMQRSGEARIADSDVAKEAAVASAGVNLNSILGQLGVQRAAAERQFAGDAADFARQQAQARIAGIREQMAAQRAPAGAFDPSDPLDVLNFQLKQLQLQRGVADLAPNDDPLLAMERELKGRQLRSALTPPGSNPVWRQKEGERRRRSPTTFSYFQQLTDLNDNPQDALAGLQADLAHWAKDKKGKGRYVVHQGKRIDPAVLRAWIKQYYA